MVAGSGMFTQLLQRIRATKWYTPNVFPTERNIGPKKSGSSENNWLTTYL